MRHDGPIAADAFVALSRIEAEPFATRKQMHDAVTAVHLAASTSKEDGDRVFAVLESNTLGSRAGDILYRITSIHGGSPAAQRATTLLADETILSRATPAMRIALEIRDAPCKKRPALFSRAAQHGDSRTLYLLQAMKDDHCGQMSCCMKTSTELDTTIGAIRTRLSENR
jgi:serine/threonine-protein kinase